MIQVSQKWPPGMYTAAGSRPDHCLTRAVATRLQGHASTPR